MQWGGTGDAEAFADVEQLARDQILAHLEKNFRGHELARLVDPVLQAEGYVTQFSPPGPDGGVDILAGRGSQGLDAPRISAVVLAAPTKNVGRTLQRIGRALRPAEGAPDPVVVDVVDSWGPYQGYARTRRAEYRRRGWLGIR